MKGYLLRHLLKKIEEFKRALRVAQRTCDTEVSLEGVTSEMGHGVLVTKRYLSKGNFRDGSEAQL